MEELPESSESEPALSAPAIRGLMVACTVIRCVMYAAPIVGGTPLVFFSVLAAIIFPVVTLSQVTIVAIATSWKVGSTKQWRQELFLGGRRLALVELVGLGFMLLGNLLALNAPIEYRRFVIVEFYLFIVTFLTLVVVLHFLPVLLQVAWLRSRGFEIVNVIEHDLPYEPARWQFRIRDLMVISSFGTR